MTWVDGLLWWVVLGALLGWVAAWWIGRSSQRLLTEPVIQIVERVVDNPLHVARIAALEGQLERLGDLEARAAAVPALESRVAVIPGLQARIDELLAAPPRVVEKVVTRTLDRVIEKPVERIVERVVERPVPDRAAIAEREAALRAQRLRVEHFETLARVLADRVASAPQPAPAPAGPAHATDPLPAAAAPAQSAAHDPVRALRQRIEHLQALATVQAGQLAEARRLARAGAAGFAMAGDTDIEIVEGIGPSIADLLRARGLGSFGALAQASPGTLREILDGHGPAYRIADPTTWPEQARLAADGRWNELRSLQDSLTAGRR